MKIAIQLKKPFFLGPHSTIGKANRIAAKATPIQVRVDDDLRSHFVVHYNHGKTAEVSWASSANCHPQKNHQELMSYFLVHAPNRGSDEPGTGVTG